eukprot:SM000117S25533  [mRNA]  locus=s117:318992:320185:- [translate_table: standard]
MAWSEALLDAVLVPPGVAALLAYHVWLAATVRRRPLATVVGVNHMVRRAWVHHIMRDNEKRSILAVQTLRNWVMASSLLASTAIGLSTAMAALLRSALDPVVRQALQSFIVGADSDAVIAVKFFCLLLCFLWAFLCYIQSIRYVNHVSFLVNIPVGPELPGLTPDYVAKVLEKGSDFYTVGTRGYYVAFPLICWLFGPIPMLVVSLLMVGLLYKLDTPGGYHAPTGSSGGSAAFVGPASEHRNNGNGADTLNSVHVVENNHHLKHGL